MTPEATARQQIDAQLAAAGWTVQSKDRVHLSASRGVAVAELSFRTGEPDYTLFVDGKALGTVEAKPVGHSLIGVEEQSTKYVTGVPFGLPHWCSPLPFCYESTGEETRFTSRLDPDPRSRNVFTFHRPETLLEWVQQETPLARRLREFPPLHAHTLWPAQFEAITHLEQSFAAGRPRALIQMATGSGKTFTAVNFIYRLVKYAGARRVLFLVDRGNLGEQTLKEFQQFVSPVNHYKFTEEYIVQHLTRNTLDTSARVVIATIQRLYSMLRGESDTAPDLDDLPLESLESVALGLAPDPSPVGRERMAARPGEGPLFQTPVPVAYNPALPIETFDFIVTDECHRSIYNLWRQVLEYFDASLIGLTATPSKQTFGFFQQNLVMEYNHEKAVADGVNVGCDIYRIQTAITQGGSKVDAGFWVDKRDRQTRKVRWEQLDEILAYDAGDLDRDVVAPDQIRTVLATFRDRVFTEMFPGRTDLPKTLIFAKDDAHADDIVRLCREVFGKGNDFCKKITYKTTGESPKALIAQFRNSYHPRIAVTVDMIATGTDIKPLEIVFFMRSVASKNFFEQMKGRGVRVVSDTEMEQVNPGVRRKTRYLIVDAVGVTERVQTESRPLEKKPTVSFEKLLDVAAFGTTDPAAIESLAGRLIRLERRFDAEVEVEVVKTARGQTLSQIAKGLLAAIDPDVLDAKAKEGKPALYEPTESELRSLRESVVKAALAPLASNPDLRNLLKKIAKAAEQTIDIISRDTLIYAGPAKASAQNHAATAQSFRDYIEQHRTEITALQLLYSRPYKQRLTEAMLKDLESKLKDQFGPHPVDTLWHAYELSLAPTGGEGRGEGASVSSVNPVVKKNPACRFADLVALVRFALEQQPVLEPFSDSVQRRFEEWLASKSPSQLSALNSQLAPPPFTPDQLSWLRLIRDHIATSLSIEPDDFEYAPFTQRGGLGKAHQLFGDKLRPLLDELNHTLAA